MKFTRVNKDTVNCIITEDDMDEQGIKLEDLFEKSKEAMDFLHEVMEKAVEEVDYKPSGAFTPMQITVLPDHSISLTLSENTDEAFAEMLKNLTEKAGLRFPKNFLEELGDVPEEDRVSKLSEYLQNLKDFTQSVKDIVEKTGPEAAVKEDNVPVQQPAHSKKARLEAIKQKEAEKKPRADWEKLALFSYVFGFNDLRTVITLCKQIPKKIKVNSTLYKDASNGKYFMLFEKADDKTKNFANLFAICYEYGKYVTSHDFSICHIQESCDLVIGEDAVERLRSL